MLRKMVAGAMGAFLWQLTPAWGHPHHHGGDDHHHHHHHDGDDDGKSLIVNPEGHGFHEVGHWEIGNSFVHLDAKVFEHAKELHDEHMEEWQADHAEEQRAKAGKALTMKYLYCVLLVLTYFNYIYNLIIINYLLNY